MAVSEQAVADVTRVVEAHASSQGALLLRLLAALFGLWSFRRVRHDPVLVGSAVAESILVLQDALDSVRDQEVAYVMGYAELLGVDYDTADGDVDPVYVRDSPDLHSVFESIVDDYRWLRYGEPRQWDEARLSAAGYDSADALVADAERFDDLVKLEPFEGSELVESDAEREARWLAEDRQLALDDAAWEQALERLSTVVEDDVQRAAGRAHSDMLAKKRVWLGYRRVIHPELSESGTCALCVVASTRVYHKRMLAPIHSHCKCTTIGVTAEADVGNAINGADDDEAWELLLKDVGGDESRIPFSRDDIAGLRAQGLGRADWLFMGDGTPVEFSEAELQRVYEAAGSTYAEDLAKFSMEFGVNQNGLTLEYRRRSGSSRERSFTPETLASTRQKWERTREWAVNQEAKTRRALDALRQDRRRRPEQVAELQDAYEAALENFAAVAERMSLNLRDFVS